MIIHKTGMVIIIIIIIIIITIIGIHHHPYKLVLAVVS